VVKWCFILIADVVLLLFVTLGLVGACCGYLSDKRKYNNGICKCGSKLNIFDKDSQGGIGWKCSNCNCYIWTSWLIVKKLNKKSILFKNKKCLLALA
jgi:hypothetical protein